MVATAAGDGPSRPFRPRQTRLAVHAAAGLAAVERWLEAEREALPLWLPVAIGAGVVLYFLLPDAHGWSVAMLTLAATGLALLAFDDGGRLVRALAIGALAAAAGVALMWWRAERVAAPVLGRPVVARFAGVIERVEPLPARDLVRLTLAPRGPAVDTRSEAVTLPARVRVNLASADAPAGSTEGGVIRLQARLMPPPGPAVPGGYDYARVAWFDGIGATGRGSAPVTLLRPGPGGGGLRERLTAHIEAALPGSAGGIAAALATGDEGAIAKPDADAMRAAGLAHLLSVSGLHITAAVTATMLVLLRLLALSPRLALSGRLPLVAALGGAAAAIGYTLLTGSQVPTIRSCVAALMVLAALAMGREAVTLRLVAAGATVVLAVWPEALAGPSFQLSFAAITSIISFHEHPRIKAAFGPHDEGRAARIAREAGSLLLTGLVVEAALMPIAVFHFHKAGAYGAVANIVAIPLTTFVVMPLEAAALLADVVGLGTPLWWLAGRALAALLWIAHHVAAAPGAVAALPAMPGGAFALMVAGGLWLALWRTRVRRWGAAPLIVGAVWALATPPPDVLVTGDGRHVALRTADGGLALLRDRTGDYTRAMLAENGGVAEDEPGALSDRVDARCSRDVCITDVAAGNRRWRVMATRSSYLLPTDQLVDACGRADLVISERRLPTRCAPRWLRLDGPVLKATGGLTITLSNGSIVTTRHPDDRHPWRSPPTLPGPPDGRRLSTRGDRADDRRGASHFRVNRNGGGYPTASPGYGSGWGHSAADRKHDWPDRAAPSRLRDGNI